MELWLLAVAAVHRARPIHDAFVVPLLIAVVPGAALAAMWALSRGATSDRPSGRERAHSVELLVCAIAAIAAAGWVVLWAREALEDARRLDAALGNATIIVDVSLTGFSLAACLAALALDTFLAAAHEQLRAAMRWLRRTHIVVTVLHVGALFASAWVFTQMPDPGTADNAAYFTRARVALHVYEFCQATVFPVQAFFAAMSVALLTADNYAD